MSTKERVIKIIDNWTEKQLEGFLVMFGADASERSETEESSDPVRANTAFQELMDMITPIPDLDDEKELAEHREEKYGR